MRGERDKHFSSHRLRTIQTAKQDKNKITQMLFVPNFMAILTIVVETCWRPTDGAKQVRESTTLLGIILWEP